MINQNYCLGPAAQNKIYEPEGLIDKLPRELPATQGGDYHHLLVWKLGGLIYYFFDSLKTGFLCFNLLSFLLFFKLPRYETIYTSD